MKPINCLLIIIAFTYIWASCKKSSDGPPDYDQGVGRCRLSAYSATLPGHDAYEGAITYNEAGKLVRVGYSPTDAAKYHYSGNRIVIEYADSANTLFYADTVLVDDAYRITYKSRSTVGSDPGGHYNYGSDGHLSTRTEISNGGSPHVTNYYVWQNGDLVKDSIPGLYEAIYSYDLSRPSQVADKLNDFLTTAGSWPKSAHLYTGFKAHYLLSTSFMQDKTVYGFDAQGKITADTTAVNRVVSAFRYDCR